MSSKIKPGVVVTWHDADRRRYFEAEFEAAMEPSRQLHKEGHLAKDVLAVAGLMEQLEQPAAEKLEPTRPPEPRKAPARRKCDHGRRKGRCKDCGTGYCKHNRRKSSCKDCGKGYCEHGRQKAQCKDCTANRQQTQ